MKSIERLANMYRAVFGSASTFLSKPKGIKVRNTSPSLGRIYRERGVMLHTSVPIIYVPDTTKKDGTVVPAHLACGRAVTYNQGRNRFKRACKTLGLNRVRVERTLRGGADMATALGELA